MEQYYISTSIAFKAEAATVDAIAKELQIISPKCIHNDSDFDNIEDGLFCMKLSCDEAFKKELKNCVEKILFFAQKFPDFKRSPF